jgi:RimJ/RimL family protein N-acetyltransferase
MLRSNNIMLAPLTSADSASLWEWINDREQVLFNSAYKPVGEVQQQDWFEAIQKRPDVVFFAVRLIETDRLVGTCQLHSINSVHRSAELQIRLGDPADRGKGYGTEAVNLLLQFAFADMNLHRVYLHVFASNQTAIAVYQKAGFVREGTLRHAAFINGEYIDVAIMGILRGEYAHQ